MAFPITAWLFLIASILFEVFGMLSRLVPELGNRGRPLGTFRYTVTTRLVEIRVD